MTKQTVNIDTIKLWDKNPREISDGDFSKLKKKIERWGIWKPFLVWESKKVILGGNQRYKACKELGHTEVWVEYREPKDEAEALEMAITDNESSGDWIKKELSDLVKLHADEIVLDDYKIDIKYQELSDLLPKEIEEDDYEEPEDLETTVVLGDVYQLGEHRLVCGDSTKIEDVEKLMNGQKADMVFTDPPYGLGGYGGRNNMELKGDDLDVQQFYDAVPTDIEERYVWGNAYNMLNLKETPRDVIVWVKNNFGLGAGYRGQYELCFYWGSFSGSDSDVWQVSKDTNYQHPTQKPVELAARAINNSSKRDNMVLDLFGGSGSTLIACEQTNRVCYMMELDEHYCQVIIDRWEKYTGKEAVKLDS